MGASNGKGDLSSILLSWKFALVSLKVVGCDLSFNILERIASHRLSICSVGGSRSYLCTASSGLQLIIRKNLL